MKKIVFTLILTSYFLLPTSTNAQSVDILWQGETYTHPFYQGLSLWSKQSKITLTAIPQGAGSPSTLYYRWLRNGTVLGDLSGFGKNTLVLSDNVLSRSQTVTVEVLNNSTYDSPIIAKSFVKVVPENPSLVAYENNPLYGFMFHREASGTYELESNESSFVAFPLFFDVESRGSGDLVYKWQTNNGGVQNKSSVTYRAPDGESGASAVYISLSNTKKIMQTASKSFLIKFGDEQI